MIGKSIPACKWKVKDTPQKNLCKFDINFFNFKQTETNANFIAKFILSAVCATFGILYICCIVLHNQVPLCAYTSDVDAEYLLSVEPTAVLNLSNCELTVSL